MELHLDGQTIDSCEALHRRLAEGLRFPDWYGRNLDALYDCLTDLREPAAIAVQNAAALRAHLGAYADVFCRVLRESAAENKNLTITWEE